MHYQGAGAGPAGAEAAAQLSNLAKCVDAFQLAPTHEVCYCAVTFSDALPRIRQLKSGPPLHVVHGLCACRLASCKQSKTERLLQYIKV
jgi:hypothetical protein